jgi:hypothetical protein
LGLGAPHATEWQRIRNQIDAAMIFAQANFVKSLAKASAAASVSPSSRKVVLTQSEGDLLQGVLSVFPKERAGSQYQTSGFSRDHP